MNLSEVHEIADAVLLVWYPGEEGGNALADILFGKISPSGRLPVTFPKSLDQLPPYEDYAMHGRTYRYMEAEPMYPFGFGLSYARFEYSGIQLSKSNIGHDEPVQVEITVTNRGKISGDEVVQMYLTHEQSGLSEPLFALKGFRRVFLDPGKSTKVRFGLSPDMLALINDEGKAQWVPGRVKISIGGSLPGKRSEALGAAAPAVAYISLKK